MIKYLVTDLDGTLFKGHGDSVFDLSEKNTEGLKRAKEAGIRVLPCSGRTYPYSLRLYELYNLGSPVLCAGLNGATIYHDGVVEEYPLDTDGVRDMLKVALEHEDLWFNIQAQDNKSTRIYIYPDVDPAPSFRLECGPSKCSEVSDMNLNEYLDTNKPILKFSLISPTKEASSKLEAIMKESFSTHYSVARSSERFLEITNHIARKGIFVKYLRDTFNLSEYEVAVIGDSGNDMDMYNYSYYTYAMNSGDEDNKRIAKVSVEDVADCIDDIIRLNKLEG